MKAPSQNQTSFFQGLFNWGSDQSAPVKAPKRPGHRADQIAADVAASGNPAGA
jgi:hypothetical protein